MGHALKAIGPSLEMWPSQAMPSPSFTCRGVHQQLQTQKRERGQLGLVHSPLRSERKRERRRGREERREKEAALWLERVIQQGKRKKSGWRKADTSEKREGSKDQGATSSIGGRVSSVWKEEERAAGNLGLEASRKLACYK